MKSNSQTRLPLTRLLLLGSAALGLALAAENSRILRFDTGAQLQGNLRDGPYNYTGLSGKPVKATINALSISSPRAVLRAPAGSSMTAAEGRRSADFSGGVTVVRGRLTAKGSQLSYSEASGEGVLSGTPSAVFTPAKQGDDPVNISAGSMSLDVDTNLSTSTGSVKLVSGTQTGRADKVIFDETRELGVLTGGAGLSRAATAKQKELNVSGGEARILTKTKLLYVKGGV
ncbi:MAG: hypothetical protein ACR2J4_04685, partial [Deinococcus sp.]